MEWLEELLGDVEGKEDIIKKAKEQIGKNFVPKSDFNAKIEEVKELQTQVSERDTQISTIKKDVKGNEELEQKIVELEAINKANAKEYQEKLDSIEADKKLEQSILSSEIKFHDLNIIKGLIDSNNEDVESQLKTIATEKPFLCIDTKVKPKGANVPGGEPTPPESNFGAAFAKLKNDNSNNTIKDPWSLGE